MASSKNYLQFVLEQLSELDEITYRTMMGEFIIYYRGKIVGGIYDDRLLVKPTKSAIAYMTDLLHGFHFITDHLCCSPYDLRDISGILKKAARILPPGHTEPEPVPFVPSIHSSHIHQCTAEHRSRHANPCSGTFPFSGKIKFPSSTPEYVP